MLQEVNTATIDIRCCLLFPPDTEQHARALLWKHEESPGILFLCNETTQAILALVQACLVLFSSSPMVYSIRNVYSYWLNDNEMLVNNNLLQYSHGEDAGIGLDNAYNDSKDTQRWSEDFHNENLDKKTRVLRITNRTRRTGNTNRYSRSYIR